MHSRFGKIDSTSDKFNRVDGARDGRGHDPPSFKRECVMVSFIVLCVLAYGLIKIGKLVKDNPAQSLEAAKWIKSMFGK